MRKLAPSLVLTLAMSGQALAADTVPMTPAQQQALGIVSAAVTPVTQSWSVAYPAQVEVPTAQLRVVSTPLAGLLETLLVAEGETVAKGQALASVLSTELLELQRNYLESLSRLDLARADWQRDKQLLEEGIIAERRYQTTHSHYLQIRTEVDQRQQSLSLAGMSKQALQALASERRLSGTLTVRSPLDGVVLEQLATPGQRLQALDPIYKVGQLSPLWLEIHVPLEQIRQTSPGSEIRVVEPRVTGKVITIGRMVHGADQGVLVRAEISQGVEQLRPGQFVEAQLASGGNGRYFRLSQSALVRQGGKTWVFVASSDGFRVEPVTVQAEETASVIVSADLNPDDRVVVGGTAALKAAWLEGAQ